MAQVSDCFDNAGQAGEIEAVLLGADKTGCADFDDLVRVWGGGEDGNERMMEKRREETRRGTCGGDEMKEMYSDHSRWWATPLRYA